MVPFRQEQEFGPHKTAYQFSHLAVIKVLYYWCWDHQALVSDMNIPSHMMALFKIGAGSTNLSIEPSHQKTPSQELVNQL